MLRTLAAESIYVIASPNRYGEIRHAVMYKIPPSYFSRSIPVAIFRAIIKRGWVEHDGNYRWRISESGRAVLAGLRDEDFIPRAPEFTSKDLLGALKDRYCPPEWIFFGELRAGSGYSYGADQRIDAWAMNCYPSKKLVKLAFEIKTSRADFRRELAKPRKREFALSVSNQFYFVTPPGLVMAGELPPDCGLMVVNADGEIKIVQCAPERLCERPSWLFIASLGRRIEHALSREENHVN
jgi:hypothetical protein